MEVASPPAGGAGTLPRRVFFLVLSGPHNGSFPPSRAVLTLRNLSCPLFHLLNRNIPFRSNFDRTMDKRPAFVVDFVSSQTKFT